MLFSQTVVLLIALLFVQTCDGMSRARQKQLRYQHTEPKFLAEINGLEKKRGRHFIMDIAAIWTTDSLLTSYGHSHVLAGDPTNSIR
jgi:hypothetical protein